MTAEAVPRSVLSIDEMVSNIVEHGYQNRRQTIFVCVWAPSARFVRVALFDRAPDTGWFHKPFPSLEDQARRLAYRGRGRAIVDESTRRVIHRRRPGGGNLLLLEFEAGRRAPQRGDIPFMPSTNPDHFVSMTRMATFHDVSVCCTAFRGVVRDTTVYRFREYLEQGGRRSPYLLVDLSGVTYLSSTGLGLLVDQARYQERLNGWLRVVNPSNPVKMILDISGLAGVLSPVPTIEDGVKDLAKAA